MPRVMCGICRICCCPCTSVLWCAWQLLCYPYRQLCAEEEPTPTPSVSGRVFLYPHTRPLLADM